MKTKETKLQKGVKGLMKNGHNISGTCEKCWSEAYMDMLDNGLSQTENYNRRIKNYNKRNNQ